PAIAEGFSRFHADIEPPEIEAWMRLGQRVDRVFKRGGLEAATVEENGAAAMRANLRKLDALASCRNLIRMTAHRRRVDFREIASPGVCFDQLRDGARAIADNLRETLFGDRRNVALGLSRHSNVEDAELRPLYVLLNDGVA